MIRDIRQLRAAYRLAEGVETLNEIAKELGLSVGAIRYWKSKPSFQAKVDQIISEQETRLKQAIGGA